MTPGERVVLQRALDAHRSDIRREVMLTGEPAKGGAGCWCHDAQRLIAATPAATARVDRLRAALDETTRMLEYLWSATGNRAPDKPVYDLFNDDDPLVQDVPTVLGKARIALHSGAALAEAPARPPDTIEDHGIVFGDPDA